MGGIRRALDLQLLDILGEIEGRPFEGKAWRVVREGRSVIDGSRGAGRWNPSHLSVLYTAKEADGAIAEIFFHLNRGQSIFPSRMRHVLYELNIKTKNTLHLPDMKKLASLGVKEEHYQELLYIRTQEIAEAADFLGFDGIIAPSARYQCDNLILFLDQFNVEDIEVISEKSIDWSVWRNPKK
ncbi:MAG: RES family NAD+ phosphorylase [Sphingomonadales bacterium]|nr:RES family NAD+ phosphorylase [Sphingomonadales bacterium]